MAERKILLLVEGEKTDVDLMERLLATYGIDERHTIVPYRTNIYALYNAAFRGKDMENVDFLMHLREHEPDPAIKEKFN